MDGAKPGALGVCMLLVIALPATAQADDDPWPLVQDDAGSGGDAPDTPLHEVWIEPGVVYEGTLGGLGAEDTDDFYAFTASAGDMVQVKTRGIFAFYRIVDEHGEAIDKNLKATVIGRDAVFPDGDPSGLILGTNYLEVELEESGTHYLRIEGYTLQHYRFVLTLNEPAPEPGYFGQGLPPPGPDAPDCHEVFSEPVCKVSADLQKVCDPVLADWICKTLPRPDRSGPLPPLSPLPPLP